MTTEKLNDIEILEMTINSINEQIEVLKFIQEDEPTRVYVGFDTYEEDDESIQEYEDEHIYFDDYTIAYDFIDSTIKSLRKQLRIVNRQYNLMTKKNDKKKK